MPTGNPLRIGLITVCLMASTGNGHAASARAEMEHGAYDSCMVTDKKVLARRGYSEAVIRKYCSCTAKVLAANLPLMSEAAAPNFQSKIARAQAAMTARCGGLIRRD